MRGVSAEVADCGVVDVAEEEEEGIEGRDIVCEIFFRGVCEERVSARRLDCRVCMYDVRFILVTCVITATSWISYTVWCFSFRVCFDAVSLFNALERREKGEELGIYEVECWCGCGVGSASCGVARSRCVTSGDYREYWY